MKRGSKFTKFTLTFYSSERFYFQLSIYERIVFTAFLNHFQTFIEKTEIEEIDYFTMWVTYSGLEILPFDEWRSAYVIIQPRS